MNKSLLSAALSGALLVGFTAFSATSTAQNAVTSATFTGEGSVMIPEKLAAVGLCRCAPDT